jgi:hypothetical protein
MKHYVLFYLILFVSVNIGFSQSGTPKPIIIKADYFDVSPPLRDMVQTDNEKTDRSWKDGFVKNHPYPKNLGSNEDPDAIYRDASIQNGFGALNPDTTEANFDGVAGDGGLLPPDPNGDVGPNHYFDIVNCKYAIYDKSGVKLLGPFATSQIWSGMPNNSNDGDGIVLYDEQADRWLVTQFSLPNYPNGPFFEMVAVSQTSDPTGSYYRYQYSFTEMPDYPKLGVWPDGYYICVNRFNTSGNYQGPGAGVFDRTKLLAGTPAASMIFFPINNTSPYHGLPADCDGTFPPLGTPGYFAWSTTAKVTFWELHADWTTPSNSTFTQSQQLPVIPFFTMGYGVGLPQKGTNVKLDPMSYGCTLMNRLQFRYFNDHWSMVTNGTVNAGNSVAGIRWYEFRKTGADPWIVYQQSTYAPDDGNSRWCGSIAMDSTGNIGLAYNITSANMYPSIRYTGRMSGDALNQLTINESGIINGGGSQTNTWSGNPSRWGDYSSLNVDPSNASTFWYTNEYYSTSSQSNWKTRIASFSFANILNINTTATPAMVCSGQSSQLNASTTGGSGTYTYSWTSVPPGFTSNIANPVTTPVQTTHYVVSVNDGTQVKTDTVLVTYQSPVVFAGNDTSYAGNVPLIVLFGAAENYSHLKWSTTGDGHFNFDTVTVVLYYPGNLDRANLGVTLHLTGYAMDPCTDTVSDEIHINLGEVGIPGQGNKSFDILLMPNPTKGNSFITVTGAGRKAVYITVTDIQGRVVWNEEDKPLADPYVKRIDLSPISKGTYFVNVKSGTEVRRQKLIIQ